MGIDGAVLFATPKTTEMCNAGVNIGDLSLPGEESDSVPVYDTCDEVRRKISAHLRRPGVTQAQFCREIRAQFHSADKPANIQNVQLDRFRSAKGPRAGAKSVIFYGAYVFFEKARIKQGRNKSKHRQEMEKLWPNGINRSRDSRTTLVIPRSLRTALTPWRI